MAINNIRINPNSGSTPSSLLEQGITSAEGGILGSITQNIKNPAIAGAAESLLGALLKGNPSSGKFQNPTPDVIDSSSSLTYSGQFKNPTPDVIDSFSSLRKIFTAMDNNNEFSKTCRYLVEITNPRCITDSAYSMTNWGQYLTAACNAAELPGVNISPVEFRHYAFTQRIAHYPVFSPITLNFYCFGGMYERDYFEFWMNQLVSFQSGLVRYPQDSNGNPLTTSDISITQYANNNTPNYIVKLFGAFPLAIGPMTVNWADDRIHEMAVTFGYTKWRTAITDFDPGQINAPPISIPSGGIPLAKLNSPTESPPETAAPAQPVPNPPSVQAAREAATAVLLDKRVPPLSRKAFEAAATYAVTGGSGMSFP